MRSDEEFGLGSEQVQMAQAAEFKITFCSKC